MNAFLAAIVAMAVIAVGAHYVLTEQLDYSSAAVTSSEAVRLD
mgnify:CR=1 FL=1